MFRTAVSTARRSMPRAAATVVRAQAPALVANRTAARWNSKLKNEQRKDELKERENINSEWNEHKLTYEDVKKRSEKTRKVW